jgi:hypothetical protein
MNIDKNKGKYIVKMILMPKLFSLIFWYLKIVENKLENLTLSIK